MRQGENHGGNLMANVGKEQALKILLVEDDDVFRATLKGVLDRLAIPRHIIGAANGEEALEAVSRERPDLIFMDIRLPGEQNGLEVTKKLKELFPEIPVIVFTLHDYPQYRVAAFKNGADRFLVKGMVSPAEILQTVESVLSEKPKGR